MRELLINLGQALACWKRSQFNGELEANCLNAIVVNAGGGLCKFLIALSVVQLGC